MDTSARAAGVDGAWVPVVTLKGDARHTGALRADVAKGAWVAVFTQARGRKARAATRAIAAIRSTRVLVVTVDRRAYAYALFAVVGGGAWVAVEAFTGLDGCVLASAPRIAHIIGTVVAIITGLFIHEPIAVVIFSVADLR